MSSTFSRRRFIATAAVGAVALPLGARLFAGTAHAQELPHLPLDNPQARALNYVEDATAAAGHAKYVAGHNCHNCNFWKGTADGAFGPCLLFPGHHVAGAGWCSAWAAKAG